MNDRGPNDLERTIEKLKKRIEELERDREILKQDIDRLMTTDTNLLGDESIKKFNSDASNKEFTLFDTPHEKYLALSFRNQPKDFKRYINATNALHVLKMPVPPVIYSSRKNVSILMHYISNDNATKYLKTKHLITILQTASNHLIKIRKSKVKFDNIPKKSNDSLIKSATWGVSLYVEHYKKKIDGYDFILNLLTKNLNNTFKKISIQTCSNSWRFLS